MIDISIETDDWGFGGKFTYFLGEEQESPSAKNQGRQKARQPHKNHAAVNHGSRIKTMQVT